MKTKLIITFTLAAILCQSHSHAQNFYSLGQCKELAVQNNAGIKKAMLEVNSSTETKNAAYTKYFPQASASFLGMYAADYLVKMETKGGNLPVYDGNPANLASATQFAYMPGSTMNMLDRLYVGNITIMQPIYAGGKISTGNKLAGVAIDINKDKLNIERYSVLEHTEDLYWKLAALKEKAITLDSYISFLSNLLKDVNVSFKAGLVDKSDVLKVSIKLSELNINKIQLQNGIDMAREAICQHMGIPLDKDFAPKDSVVDIVEPKELYLDPGAAVANRFEMNLLENAVKAEQLQTDLKRGEYLPEIGVGTALMCVNAMNKTNLNALFIGSVSVPISGWWEASHLLQERRIREEITSTTRKETAELLVLQISRAWKEFNEAYNNIELGRKMVDEAAENYKATESNFKAGVIGMTDYLEAKAVLQKSRDQLTEYKTNYKHMAAMYLQAIGKY